MRSIFYLLLAGVFLPGFAHAAVPEPTISELAFNIDIAWILTSAALVLFMQAGFMLLEAGMVRSKNSINVAQKNLVDFVASVVTFGIVGFTIAFGVSNFGIIGFQHDFLFLNTDDAWTLAFFVFQVMFCGTAATIVSGAVAERMRLHAYALTSIFIAGLAYPVFAHWAWGNALTQNPGAFLANAGFIDFAGSTVVHSTGAWIALAACIVIGAREGRFDENGKPVRFQGHSPVLATSGAMILFVGWIGFNGGSALAMDKTVPGIVANTVLAAGTGALAGFVGGWAKHRVMHPEQLFSGMIGGLVAVTAGCAVLGPQGAMLIGLLGGGAAIWGMGFLEERLKVDDAVGAVSVHGISGAVGTVGLALLAPAEALVLDSRLDQFLVQLAGVGMNFVWSFGLGLVFFLLLRRIMPLRATREDEERGLNESEHGSRLGTGHVEHAVSELLAGNADLHLRLPVTPGEDSARMTDLFNRLMDSIENEELQRAHRKEVQLRGEEAERLSAMANATFEAIVISRNGYFVDGNEALASLLGLPIAELKGKPMFDFVAERDREICLEAQKKKEVGPYELTMLSAFDEEIPVEVRAREVNYQGSIARISAIVDLRERKIAEDKIRHLAQSDPLTNLPNRAVFSDKLSHAMMPRLGTPGCGAVLLVDLDRFKDINDLHGHQTGDEVICAAADRLRSGVRKSDMVARLGGDEFAVLLNGYDFKSQVIDLAHRLVHALSQPIDCGSGLAIRTSISVGIAFFPDDSTSPQVLLSKSDTALYKAKAKGRNTYCAFEEGMDAEIAIRREVEAELSDAIANEQFTIHLQPRFDISTLRINSYEALIRWNHPTKGLVPPDMFIPVAEQSSRIIDIGRWVLRTACESALHHLDDETISINVSPTQFRDKGFVPDISRALEETGLAPERLELEITESVLIDEDEWALQILKSLKKIGVRIALDDFGTGYSSLAYLNRFPFDCLKIDRAFVMGISDSVQKQAIVDAVVRLANSLGMTVVAEGVETRADVQTLIESGCNELQGFIIGRPAPVDEMVKTPSSEFAAALAEYGVDKLARLFKDDTELRMTGS